MSRLTEDVYNEAYREGYREAQFDLLDRLLEHNKEFLESMSAIDREAPTREAFHGGYRTGVCAVLYSQAYVLRAMRDDV